MKLSKIAIAAASGFVIFVSLGLVLERGPIGADASVLQSLEAARTPFLDAFMYTVTVIGAGWTTTLFTLVFVVILVGTKHVREAIFLGAVNIGSGVLSPLTKAYFARPRPVLVSKITNPTSGSFPSGHALSATVLYISLALVAFHVAPRWFKPAVIIAAIMVPLMGFTRLYLGVHYPSDVLGGWALGAAWVFFAYSLYRKADHSSESLPQS